MKKLFAFIFLIVAFSASAQYHQSTTQYEYKTIVNEGLLIVISGSDNEFKKINLKSKQRENKYDFREMLKLAEDYSAEGWEIHSSNLFYINSVSPYMILRREKKKE